MQIDPLTRLPLARLHSPAGSLLSLYLNRHGGPSAALLSDLLRPVKARLDGLDRTVGLSLREDVRRIAALDAVFDADPAPAHCVFASHADDVFEVFPLSSPVWDHVSFGRRPYLRPLRTLPEPLRAGMVVADRRRASVFVSNGGGLLPLGEPVVAARLKGDFGGFRGYEEHRVRHHADEEARRVLVAAAERLFEEHRRQPLDFLSLGGHQETLESLVPHLHPYLRRLPVVTFVVDPHTMTEAELRSRADQQACDVRRGREQQVVDAVLEARGAGAPTALGAAAVLEAVSARAVERMVVAGRFTRPGVLCAGCGWLARTGSSCPACGSEPEQVDDILAEAMEAVVAAGGEAYQVSVASPLDVHGVGALLRFPLA